MTHDQTPNETPQRFFAFTAVFYLVGLVTSNAALQFISYPSQVVGKGGYEMFWEHSGGFFIPFLFQLLNQFQQ